MKYRGYRWWLIEIIKAHKKPVISYNPALKLVLFQTCVILPIHALFKTTIDIQISYFSGVRSSKYYFDNYPDHLHATTHSTCWIFLNPKTKIEIKMWSPLRYDQEPIPPHYPAPFPLTTPHMNSLSFHSHRLCFPDDKPPNWWSGLISRRDGLDTWI